MCSNRKTGKKQGHRMEKMSYDLLLSSFKGKNRCYMKNSSKNTTPQHATAVLNKSAPNQAAKMPTTKAAAPDTGLCVAVTIAGKVITDRVTYGT